MPCHQVDWGLYLITDEPMLASLGFAQFLDELLYDGLQIIQLRAKSLPTRDIITIGGEIRRLTRQYGCTFIVNDRPELALELEADGIHVGQSDMDPVEVRRIVGPDLLIGLSTHNKAQVLQASEKPIDYIGVGPVFATATKADADPVAGVELLEWAERNSAFPPVAIGGITLDNLGQVLSAGARNVAIISAISRSVNPAEAAREFMRRINESNSRRMAPQ
jgi:thiamine-phosphate pyrophosphorylase